MTIETFKKNWKRYAWSSLITFITAFLIIVLPEFDNISLSNLTDGTLIGLGFVAIRAGLKAVLEGLLFVLTKK